MKRSCAGLTAVAAFFVLTGCSSTPDSGAGAAAGDGWTTLLDRGYGMEYFDQSGEEANWHAMDGAVHVDKGGKTPSYLVTKSTYDNFMLRVEFWASDDANSGIFMRCQDRYKITDKSCYEANIFDQRPDPTYGTGAIVHFAKIGKMPKAGGKWNVYEITAQDTKITVRLNGEQTVTLDDPSFKSGPVALQWGRGTMKFRKVQIKRI